MFKIDSVKVDLNTQNAIGSVHLKIQGDAGDLVTRLQTLIKEFNNLGFTKIQTFQPDRDVWALQGERPATFKELADAKIKQVELYRRQLSSERTHYAAIVERIIRNQKSGVVTSFTLYPRSAVASFRENITNEEIQTRITELQGEITKLDAVLNSGDRDLISFVQKRHTFRSEQYSIAV